MPNDVTTITMRQQIPPALNKISRQLEREVSNLRQRLGETSPHPQGKPPPVSMSWAHQAQRTSRSSENRLGEFFVARGENERFQKAQRH